jgi:hypothetical protein
LESKKGKRVVVHLGPEKTGTTALAEYFSVLVARNQLDQSIIFPSGDLWFNRHDRIQKHNSELRSLGQSFSEGTLSVEQDRVLTRLRERVIALAPLNPTVVLIFELGLAKSEPAALTALLLKYFDAVTFVVAARHQDTAIRSLISQRVGDIEDSAWTLDIASYLGTDSIEFDAVDYALMAERWRHHDKRVELKFIPFFESDPGTMNLIRRFFVAADLPKPVEGRRISGRRIHPTLSATGLERLAVLKIKMRRWGAIPVLKKRFTAQFEREWNHFHSSAMRGEVEPNGKMYRPWSLTPLDAEWVHARYSESNKIFLAELDRTGSEKEWEQWQRGLIQK